MAIGQQVRFHVKRPTRRCVITTLAQSELPRDLGILKTAAQYNAASVGVYATVLRGGVIDESAEAFLSDRDAAAGRLLELTIFASRHTYVR